MVLQKPPHETSHAELTSEFIKGTIDNDPLYTYQPLEPGEIRLLILEAGHSDHALNGRMVSYRLTSGFSLSYTALSYCWGPPIFSERLYVPEHLPITPTLHSALRRIRHQTESTHVWADAACINQSDLTERNEQIQSMGNIYRQAAQVVICLGEEYDRSELVPFLVPAADRTALPVSSNYLNRSEDLREDPTTTATQFIFAWRAFLRRPWFMRLWVIQEAALAATAIAVCGSWAMHLSDLVRLADGIIGRAVEEDARMRRQTFNGGRQLLMMGRVSELIKSKEPIDMLWLLSRTRRSLTTVPADYLWGVQGLDWSEDTPALTRRYLNDLDGALKLFAKHFIDVGQGMEMLYYAHVDSWRSRIPSWTPGWATHDDSEYSRFWDVSFTARSYYHGSVGCAKINLSDDGEILSTDGRQIGTIDELGNNHRHLLDLINNNPKKTYSSPLQYWTTTADSMLSHPTLRDQQDVSIMKWSTLVIGGPEYELFMSRTKILSNDERNKLLTKPISKSKEVDETYGPWYVGEYIREAIRTGQNLRLARSSQVGICQVPYGSEAGDDLVLLRASRVPFVLRQVSGSSPDKRYRVVGPCFVHGYMGASKAARLDCSSFTKFELV